MGTPEITKLIDTTRCTACRGCQVACKQWNELPGKRTRNFGSYQNPPDLQSNTWTLIRFQEHVDAKGTLKWLFRKDGCMHCTDAACVKVCPSGALYYSEFGTVGLKENLCIGCKECTTACPFHIPKYDGAKDKIYKCDLCLDRLRADGQPACVKSCPTGALTIGGKDAMVKAAYRRARELGGDANVYGDKFVGGTHVLYVLGEKPSVYDALPENPAVPLSIVLWKDLLKPLSLIAAGGVLAGSFLHYILHGPKLPDENGNGEPPAEGGK
ncbi:MAG: Formate dehydrogenase-O iron-sulfur subunit [Syntrophaceae bacterium PtaU1.Bin231]|nr:MAG: Formate dehydrogenase-O iron-sulfur subunit [Syntrophaceae bacterium PtaU1.Bin231]